MIFSSPIGYGIGIILTLLLLVASLLGGGLVHGFEHQFLISISISILGIISIWLLYFKTELKIRGPLIAGLIFLPATLYAPFFIASELSMADRAAKLQGTKVSDVTDEPILNKRGNPIGIKVTFSVIFPETGRYTIYPMVRPGRGLGQFMRSQPKPISDQYYDLFSHNAADHHILKRTITPFPEELNSHAPRSTFDAIPTSELAFSHGKPYAFKFELYPLFLKPDGKKGFCRVEPGEQNHEHGLKTSYAWMEKADLEMYYEMEVFRTNFGRESKMPTSQAYNPARFYRAVLEGNYPICSTEQANAVIFRSSTAAGNPAAPNSKN